LRLRAFLISLLALLIASSWIASLVVSAQKQETDSNIDQATLNNKASANAQAFVVKLNAFGKVSCRPATPSERRQIMQRRGEGELIYAGAPRQGEKRTNPKGAQLPDVQTSAGLRIVLHGTSQLNQNVTAKNAFIRAANHWESIISTPITVVLDVDFGTTVFGTQFPSPDILGATGTEEDTRPFNEVRQRLLENSPTQNETNIYALLPTNSVPTELSSRPFKSLTVRLSRANARGLGFLSNIIDPDAIPLGSGDAGIGFNSAFPFDFDPNNGVDSNKVDFDSVATHEIGHALGFLSESGGPVYAPVSVWDLFRFRQNAANTGTFATAPRIMTSGGTQVYFNGQANTFGTQELKLSTGGPFGDAGDGNQSSHWKDDDLTFQYIGIMDPNIGDGETNPITTNDVNTLDSFGYAIGSPVSAPPQAPPLPPAVPPNDNFANATVIQDVSGGILSNSTGGTKESGEPDMLPGNTGGVGGRSVWYRWTSPVNGSVTFDTEGSGYDTIIAVSTGTAVNSLTRLGQNDDIVAGDFTASRLTLNVTAGVTYRIAVDGFDNGAGAEFGIIELNWSATGTTPSPTPTPTPTPSFSITGRVLDPGNNGVAGFRLVLDGPNLVTGLPHAPVLTDATGNFQFTQLTPGGSYTVRPNDARFTVSPTTIAFPNIAANQSSATFTATLIIGTVFGRVIANGQPLPGVLVGLGQLGVITQTMTTGADGRWSFTGTLIGQAYEVPFVKSGYSIFPPSLIFPINVVNQEMGDVTATKGNNIDASDFFVAQHYDDFLGRSADAPGLSFWTNNIEGCTFSVQCRAVKRIDTSAAFFLSIEFQETGYLVYRAYQAAYGNSFDATIVTPGSPSGYPVPNIRRSEFVADTPLISQGVQVGIGNWQQQLEANKQAFMLAFVGRQRFTSAFPSSMTADEFVTKLDQNAGGVLSAGEKSLLVSMLGSTPADLTKRSQVLRAVAEDADLNTRETNRAFVLMQYFGYLRRNPNDAPEQGLNYAGFKFWLDKLNSFNGDFRAAEMVKSFIISGEYRGRFGP
jgi:hypothetical protein